MAEPKNKSATVVGKTEQRHIPNRFKRAIPIVVVVIVLVVGLAIYLNHRNDERKAQLAAKTVCETSDSGALLNDAAESLEPTQTIQLKPILKQIQALKSYQQDPNCLYVAVTYYLNIQDPINAQAYLTKFNKVYTTTSLSKRLTGYQSVAEMRKQVAELQVIQKEAAKNMIGIPQP
jgi:hypothetical protein